MASHTILSTKKLAPALKEALVQKGIEVVEQEFITIHPILTEEKHQEVFPWITREAPTAVVFTSRHAAETVSRHLHPLDTYYVPQQWQIYCLQGATREAVLQYHDEKQIAGTASSAENLAKEIIEQGRFKEVVFFCGNQRRNELPDTLRAHGIAVQEVVVYETTEVPQIATPLSGQLDAILFFSPSAVKSFFTVNKLPAATACFAIGPTTASTIGQYTNNKIITSEASTQETMVANVTLYLQNIHLHK